MANKEITLELTGKSGNKYAFFPQYLLAENKDSKGAGIYVFGDKNDAIADIQFLSDDEEVTATLQRMKDDGVEYFYFTGGIDALLADADIDDIKAGDDYRKKID